MSQNFDKIVSALLALAAVSVTATVVHREFAPPPSVTLPPLDRPVFVQSWNETVANGIVIGNPGAAVKLIEFADLECPYCRQFHQLVAEAMDEHPGEVALVFVHYPLPSHRFAVPAARAVECAAAQGRAPQLIRALYAKQDSIGMKSWVSYGLEAGLADTAALLRCASGSTVPRRVDSGRELGVKMKVTGTPTVLVNGWRYARAPGKAELEQIIRTVLAGGSPADTSRHPSG